MTPSTSELKQYFAQLLTSSRPEKKISTRRCLIGIGESLTSSEAKERLENDLEEKRKKEKRKQKEMSKGKSKKRKGTSTTTEKQSRVMCAECEMYFDLDEGEGTWIECELCFNWFHAACVGFNDELADEIQFVCDSCL